MSRAIKIHQSDNAAVLLDDTNIGGIVTVDSDTITAMQNIPSGHKIALCDIAAGQDIIKYGNAIGFATADIERGGHIHSHNMKTKLSDIVSYEYSPKTINIKPAPSENFMGYRRSDGSVGIRNEIWIIPTVGCVNGIAKQLERLSSNMDLHNIDGVYSYTHPFGCSQLGEDHKNTQKLLAGLVHHPNAAGVLVLGLGCENNLISEFKKILGDTDDDRVKFLETQSADDEIESAMTLISQLIDTAKNNVREPIPVSELVVGLKCGGSDGFSGITANPMVGVYSDMLTAKGGSTILTEVPEMFGAEASLMERCSDISVYNKTVDLINGFKQYYKSHNQPIYENPSPGNKAGGITTLEEKSLGCTQKSGSNIIIDVLDYGQLLTKKGLNLLSAPGNDLVASTALVASGAHIVLFTTGRGTPFGSPAPTIKISTNSSLADRKNNWIDFDAGKLLTGSSMTDLANDFYNYVLRVASGDENCKAEQNGYREISIFKDGVFL